MSSPNFCWLMQYSLFLNNLCIAYSFSRYFSKLAMSTSTINKKIFDSQLDLIAIKIPAASCSNYLKNFKDLCFKKPKFKNIHNIDNEPNYRLFLLNEEFQDDTLSTLPANLKDFNQQHNGIPQRFSIHLGYDHLSVDEVLRKVLPSDVEEIPSSFEQAGHLAHVNLREETLPYKSIIGQVILDKNPSIKTVVNKVGLIETEFRTFPMEVLAGENDFNVTLKESGAKFSFNFSEVYWNSRLQMEHSRLINKIKNITSSVAEIKQNKKLKASGKGEDPETNNIIKNNTATNKPAPRTVIVADMMAGVGPFAVPLAMNHQETINNSNINISVYANDLNPASYKYLVQNAKANHCGKYLVPYNMDGREFIVDLVTKNKIMPNEVIMNLPQNATDFLDVFIGLATRFEELHNKNSEKKVAQQSQLSLPRIHVYGFSTHETNPILDMIHRAAYVLQCSPNAIIHNDQDRSNKSDSYWENNQQSIYVTNPLYGIGRNKINNKKDSVNNANEKEVFEFTPSEHCEGHVVRDVAPKKVMICLSFTLPKSVAFATPKTFSFERKSEMEDGIISKKAKIDT